MPLPNVENLASALLYEGYLLYPYRPSALKNRRRWTLGTLFPESWCQAIQEADPSAMQAECLLIGQDASIVEVQLRFLHSSAPRDATVTEKVTDLLGGPRERAFRFSSGPELVECVLALSTQVLDNGVFCLSVRVENRTPLENPGRLSRDEALAHAMLSAHMILRARDGEFVSLLDPPEALRLAAADCRNLGLWPVLVGEPGRRDTMLAAPVILSEYPQVAPESPGNLFDGTEIDELLTLRILTLTDAEKAEMSAGIDGQALLARTEALGAEHLARLHGTWRGAASHRVGDRVRLRPRPGADIFDLALAGRIATIQAIEEDFEDRVYLSVTVDDDPGQDLGLDGKPGHRFFFRPDEVEPLGGGS